jgi:nitrogen regulatory protein PII
MQPVVDAMLKSAETGKRGAGKIVISRVAEAIRIATDERAEAAV